MNIFRIDAIFKIFYSFKNIGGKLITTKSTKKNKDSEEFTQILKRKMK